MLQHEFIILNMSFYKFEHEMFFEHEFSIATCIFCNMCFFEHAFFTCLNMRFFLNKCLLLSGRILWVLCTLQDVLFAPLHTECIESVQPTTLVVTRFLVADSAWVLSGHVSQPMRWNCGRAWVTHNCSRAQNRVNGDNIVSRVWVCGVQHGTPILVLQEVLSWGCIQP
jgi:hypothetical protein